MIKYFAMALAAGTRLGPYEIISAIGAGGMGEVYRAKDTRLDRIVAIKVLPSHLSHNEQLKQRFEREARTISSLSHPHICALHDIGHQEGVDFLVMEYLEGETLARRLEKGPLSIDQLIKYGIQIAEALDRAHRQGVIHRDLKPGNIMLTRSGAKLLDFGLAKFESMKTDSLSSELATRAPLTEEGTVLGTVQYMSPEQLDGREADGRTDIFAFGEVLYEMATGQRAFKGNSKAQLIASILSSEPQPVSNLQPLTPPALDHVIRRCIAKDPEDRWQSAQDVASELKWISESISQPSTQRTAAAPPRRKFKSLLAWGVAVLFLITTLVSAFQFYRLRKQSENAQLLKLSILPEEGTVLNLAGSIAISPDGLKMAYTGITKDGQTALFVRPLDSMESRRLPGTDDANFPFWSPDSTLIGFFAQGKLKKIDIVGGPPQTLCDASAGRGGSWNKDGTILFSAALGGGLYRIPGAGGEISEVTKLDPAKDESTHRFPVFLPDGDHYLFVVHSVKAENSGIFLSSLKSKEKKRLLGDESVAMYSPPGYLLFVREGNLEAQQFDLFSFTLSGEAVPIAEGVYFEPSASSASMTISANGLLAYSQASGNQYQQFVWFNREGKQVGLIGDPGIVGDPWLSPDETKVAHYNFRASLSGKPDIWIADTRQGTFTRFTFDSSNDFTPIWTPDGSSIIYSCNAKGSYDLYQKTVTGVGEEKILYESKDWKFSDDITSDGKYLIFEDDDPKSKADIWALPLTGDRKPFPIIQTEFNEAQANVSPDGKWIAYGSDETGRAEIYIQSFPRGGSKRQISTGGGAQPRWAKNQKEIFYMAPDSKIMSVEIKTEDTLEVGVPTPLFAAHVPLLPLIGNDRNQYAVTADSQKFLVNRLAAEGVATPITIVFNWTKLLKK